MRIKHPLLPPALGLLASTTLRWLRNTIDWRAVYFDPTVDPVHPNFVGRYVYVGWHEYMLMPIALRGSPDSLALASHHGDGEIISRALEHLNWNVVRGSTTKGATTALLRILRGNQRHLCVTPDGPRGPRRTFSPGAIFLASKLGLPLQCVGYAYDRPIRVRSWDRFAIPRPFSRCRAVFGPPVRLPEKLSRDHLEHYRVWCQRLLNWLTDEAEVWAADGRRRHGEMPMLVGELAPPMLRWEPSWSPKLPADLNAEWMTFQQNHLQRRVA